MGRDIIVNINQDDRQVVTPETLLSDRDSSAKGYVTKKAGSRWLNNSLDFRALKGEHGQGQGRTHRRGAERPGGINSWCPMIRRWCP